MFWKNLWDKAVIYTKKFVRALPLACLATIIYLATVIVLVKIFYGTLPFIVWLIIGVIFLNYNIKRGIEQNDRIDARMNPVKNEENPDEHPWFSSNDCWFPDAPTAEQSQNYWANKIERR